jgi:hypothetical protein
MPIVEQKLPTLPEHLSSPPVCSGVLDTQSLVYNVCFVDHCLPFCTVSFGHCVVCSSSIHGFWLPLWNFQTLQTRSIIDILWRIQMLMPNLVSIHLHLCSCFCDDMQMKNKKNCMAVICFSIRLKALRRT